MATYVPEGDDATGDEYRRFSKSRRMITDKFLFPEIDIYCARLFNVLLCSLPRHLLIFHVTLSRWAIEAYRSDRSAALPR